MKCLLLTVFISLFLCIQAWAEGNIIDRRATPTEATAQTRNDVWLSPSSIPHIMAVPGEIGSTTPAAGNFTTLGVSTDPVDADGVGDRGYNDLRYLHSE